VGYYRQSLSTEVKESQYHRIYDWGMVTGTNTRLPLYRHEDNLIISWRPGYFYRVLFSITEGLAYIVKYDYKIVKWDCISFNNINWIYKVAHVTMHFSSEEDTFPSCEKYEIVQRKLAIFFNVWWKVWWLEFDGRYGDWRHSPILAAKSRIWPMPSKHRLSHIAPLHLCYEIPWIIKANL
jgi:hypothetical protein